MPVLETWKHCSPALLRTPGFSCADTQRRLCQCPEQGSHDHLIKRSSEISIRTYMRAVKHGEASRKRKGPGELSRADRNRLRRFWSLLRP